MGVLFDGYVAADWSASSKPKTGEDSIWIAIRGWGEITEPEKPRDAHGGRGSDRGVAAARNEGGTTVAVWVRLSVRISEGHGAYADRRGWLGKCLGADR